MLNHVCKWSPEGWKKTTEEEAAKNYPRGTSAHGGLFKCELCNQNVIFVNAGVQRPHFRHSKSEQDKKCEERIQPNFAADMANLFTRPRHDLPIKICVNEDDFYFELGLIRLPNEIFNKVLKSRLTIASEHFERKYSLSDHLREDDITWLKIGNILDESYTLDLEPKCDETFFYWSHEIKYADNRHDILFDGKNGIRLPPDSDVRINKKYYLLTESNFISQPADVDIVPVAYKSVRNKISRLYAVQATAFMPSAANFFWNYGCRLAPKPISIKAIWPIYTTESDIIRHDSPTMFFYLSGDATAGFFPSARNSVLSDKNNGKLLKVECNTRQQIISIGHTQPSQYNYLWQGLPSSEITPPEVTVTDVSDNVIPGGISVDLPKNAILQVQVAFDVRVVISKNGILVNKIFIKADNRADINALSFGMEIKIFQGLDCVWEICYEHSKENFSQSDEDIYHLLKRGKGKSLKVPHTWGSLADKLSDYPKVKNWLYKIIRLGVVPEESYSVFRQFLLDDRKV